MPRLAAVTGCTADFTIGTAALLRTLQKHHPEVRRVVFTLPEQVASVTGSLGNIAEVLPIPRVLKNAPSDPKILASWARVFIPTIDADAVAWFDSDVILCRPASEWWQVPTGKVNAVHDRAYRVKHMVPHGMEAWYFGRFNLDPEARGFNAGIFALRPADHQNLAERFEALLAEQDATKQPFAFDQGLLNGLMLNDANILPPEFNAHCLAECGVPRGVRAIHYTGSPKPWATGYDRATEGYRYWLEAGDADPAQLNAVKRSILLAKPKRFAKRAIRKIATTLKLTTTEMGVGKRPDAP